MLTSIDTGSHLVTNRMMPLYDPLHTIPVLLLPMISSTIELTSSCADPPLGPSSFLAHLVIVSRILE